MEILVTLRYLAGIPPIFFSKLLNITVHTYIAYEQGKMLPPPEIIKMIAMLYDIEESVLYDFDINDSIIKHVHELSEIGNDAKYKLLSSRILGGDITPNYRNIRKAKEKIKESIKK